MRKRCKFFYANCRVTNALDENEKGGFKLLLRQMMDAVGKKYAVHEIVWRTVEASGVENAASETADPSGSLGTAVPTIPTQRYTAEFRFVPLWFFENTTGSCVFCRLVLGSKARICWKGRGW
jgi:hypothetical protein